jgi:hypothetical protein
MSTEWVITTAAERITLDAAGKGETTLTVTNPGRRADRAVFDVVVGGGADPAWFSVEDPQRLVRPNASTPYLIKVAVPVGAKPGSYAVQGRVFSADEAPEESSVLSPRVLLEVPVPPAPPQKKRPWWIWVVAALVALVLATVIWLIVPTGDQAHPTDPQSSASGDPSPTVSAAPPPGYEVVPSVLGMKLPAAELALVNRGFKLGRVTYKVVAGATGTVSFQSTQPVYTMVKGSPIDLDVSVPPLVLVTMVSPAANAHLPKTAVPRLEWKSPEPYVSRWMVQVLYERCASAGACQTVPKPANNQESYARSRVITTTPVYELPPALNFDFAPDGLRDNGKLVYAICPLDHLGNFVSCNSFTLFLDQ